MSTSPKQQGNPLIEGLASLAGALTGGPMGAAMGSAIGYGLSNGFDDKDGLMRAGISGFTNMLTGGTAGVALNALASSGGNNSGLNGLIGLVANAPQDRRVLSGMVAGGMNNGMQGAVAGGMNQMLAGTNQMSPVNILGPAGSEFGITDPNGVPLPNALGGLLYGGLREALYNGTIGGGFRVRDDQTMTPLQQQQFATGERRPDYKGTPVPDMRLAAEGGYIEGPGTGTSDSVPAAIYQDGGRVQEARLSDGEFVMTEEAVRGAGGGNRQRGAERMYQMMDQFEGAA